MKITTESIEDDGRIHKYVMVHQGSKKWRRTFFACVDHAVITPIYEKWKILPNSRRNPASPRLLEVIVDDDALVEKNYSEVDSEYESGFIHAKGLADKLLSRISSEKDLFNLIMDKEFNWAYPNIVHNDVRVLAGAVIISLEQDTPVNEAILKSEEHFDRTLAKKDLLLRYMDKKKLVNVKGLLQNEVSNP